MGIKEKVQAALDQGALSQSLAEIFLEFYEYYLIGAKGRYTQNEMDTIAGHYLEQISEQYLRPYPFDIYNTQIREPFDYYAFGLDFFRPLVDFSKSSLHGSDHLDTIEASLKRGDNVILFSNHQIEPDPQAIQLSLENSHPELAKAMIFVAGHRVVTDPTAVPFSKAVNLLSIFSKNYIENPPELKHQKVMHNRRTMQKMVELLSEGGKCIYVAPSGGRDRPSPDGTINVSPFDPNSIEMFRLMTLQSQRPTHFHTLALATYKLQPPPNTIEKNIGERRLVFFTPIHLAFGPEIDMEMDIPAELDKTSARQYRCERIWNQVKKDYDLITKQKQQK